MEEEQHLCDSNIKILQAPTPFSSASSALCLSTLITRGFARSNCWAETSFAPHWFWTLALLCPTKARLLSLDQRYESLSQTVGAVPELLADALFCLALKLLISWRIKECSAPNALFIPFLRRTDPKRFHLEIPVASLHYRTSHKPSRTP